MIHHPCNCVIRLELNVRLCACVEGGIASAADGSGWRRLGCRTNRRHCRDSAGGTGVGSCRGWDGPTRNTGWRSGRETREPAGNRGTTRSTGKRKGNGTRGRTGRGGTARTRWCETSPAACGPTVMTPSRSPPPRNAPKRSVYKIGVVRERFENRRRVKVAGARLVTTRLVRDMHIYIFALLLCAREYGARVHTPPRATNFVPKFSNKARVVNTHIYIYV